MLRRFQIFCPSFRIPAEIFFIQLIIDSVLSDLCQTVIDQALDLIVALLDTKYRVLLRSFDRSRSDPAGLPAVNLRHDRIDQHRVRSSVFQLHDCAGCIFKTDHRRILHQTIVCRLSGSDQVTLRSFQNRNLFSGKCLKIFDQIILPA